MFSADMTGAGGSLELYPEPDDQGDVIDHPAHNLPMPMQPRAPKGTDMAGDVIPIRTVVGGGVSNAMTNLKGVLGQVNNENRSGSDRTNVTPIKKP